MTVTLAPGVAVVVPVHGRAHELRPTVEAYLDALVRLDRPHTVVVVDDASRDAAGELAEWLACRLPGRIEVVRLDDRRGRHAATRVGAEAALARTDHPIVLLTDGGAVGARNLPELLADEGRAALVRGRRRSGEDSYHLVDRALLERIAPSPDDVALGPELAAWAHEEGLRVDERRPGGLPPARRRAPSSRRRPRSWRSLPRRAVTVIGRGDPVLAAVTGVAALVSVLATGWFLAAGATLAYPDAVAHLLIARRVVASSTPGASQLGGVWLPLPHLLAVPTVWSEPLFLTGLAGALGSMGAFVLCARYLYRTVAELTGSRVGAAVAATVLLACPNVLYLQSTPMTELPLLCGIAGATYHLVRWTRTDRHRDLAAAGATMLLVTLVRYEAWPFCLAGLLLVVVVAWRRARADGGPRRRRVEAHLVYFATLATAGIAGWVLWNTAILGDPLFFVDGEYSESALWVGAEEATAGSWPVTLETYWYAVVDNVGAPLAVAGAVALALFAVTTRLHSAALAAALPLVLLPFFLVFLYTGQRPLHVLEVTGDRNNVRFGLVVIVPIALLLGWLVAQAARRLRRPLRGTLGAVAVVLVAAAALPTAGGGIATLEEARFFRSLPFEQANARVAQWLRTSYDGGPVLMNNFGNQTVAFDSRVPTAAVVHDGSYGRWEPALADPLAAGVSWIYMREGEEYPDPVWTRLHDSPALRGYTLVYDADGRRVYHRAARPDAPVARTEPPR